MGTLSQKQKEIIHFFESVAHSGNNFRQQVLLSFAEIFKLEHSTFFLIDCNENLGKPVTLNVDAGSTTRYVKNFQRKDIFHPHKLSSKKLIQHPVMSITDIMPLQEYEKTEYYNDFLKKQGFYHEIIIALSAQEKLLGCIGLCRSKKEGFDQETKGKLKLVHKFLAGMLAQYLAQQQTVTDQKIYHYCINENPMGMILFDENFSIIFANNAANETAAVLFNKKMGLEQFVNYAVSLSGKLFPVTQVTSLRLYSPALSEFSIQIVPLNNYLQLERKVFLMKMIPGDSVVDNPRKKNIQETYNLTKRELEVLSLILEGLTNNEVGQMLFISPSTVKAHLRSILTKTNAANRLKLFQKLQKT